MHIPEALTHDQAIMHDGDHETHILDGCWVRKHGELDQGGAKEFENQMFSLKFRRGCQFHLVYYVRRNNC